VAGDPDLSEFEAHDRVAELERLLAEVALWHLTDWQGSKVEVARPTTAR
jgi:hypothetical protein